MNKKITMGTFDCTQQNINAIVSVMESGYLSTGKEMVEFESVVAQRCSKKYGLMVSSGQSALEVALTLAKIKLKKSQLTVILPATTYAATLWAVLNTNCIPVFCDVNQDYNIDYKAICHIDFLQDCDVILSVDLCGKSSPPPSKIKDKYYIIEDACEALGNKNCCYGDIVCFSFYVSHIITAGSGGMLCLDDKELLEYAQSYISHGRKYGGDFTKHKDSWVDRFSFDKVGVSCRSDNMSAALGLSQFQRVDEIIEKRRKNALRLIERYENSEFLRSNYYFPDKKYAEDSVFQFFPVLIKNIRNISRHSLLLHLFNKGIDSRVLLSLTNQSIVKELYGNIEEKYPFSAFCNKHGFIVGCHQNLSVKDMDYFMDQFENYGGE